MPGQAITLGPKPVPTVSTDTAVNQLPNSVSTPTGASTSNAVERPVETQAAAPIHQTNAQKIQVQPSRDDTSPSEVRPEVKVPGAPMPVTLGASLIPGEVTAADGERAASAAQGTNGNTEVSITVASPPAPQTEKKKLSWRGGIANSITFALLVVGIIVNAIMDEDSRKYNFVLAIGLFGFAGGITNWLAVKMLFDKIPGLYGSGIIPLQYKNIRQTVKKEIMTHFFDEAYLGRYIAETAPNALKKLNLGKRVMDKVHSPEFDTSMVEKLEEIAATPSGAMLGMLKPLLGGSLAGIVPMVKPLIVNMAEQIAAELSGEGSAEAMATLIPVSLLRSEIDALMTDRLNTLTPEVVTQLLEDVIRDHLGWLVVWGNVFGALIGIVALAVTGEV